MRFIVCGIIFFTFFSAVPEESATEYGKFKKLVSETYKKLHFNESPLNISGIRLGEINKGIAYAKYNPKTNSRVILLHYRFLSKTINRIIVNKSNNSNNTAKVSLIAGILAHEWAHHYLGHIFNKPNIIYERNADIIAGRVLSQNNFSVSTLNDINKLFEGFNDSQHLDPDIRDFLILKGYTTEQTIKNHRNGGYLIDTLAKKYNQWYKGNLKNEWKRNYIKEVNKEYFQKLSTYNDDLTLNFISHKLKMESKFEWLLLDTTNNYSELTKVPDLLKKISDFNYMIINFKKIVDKKRQDTLIVTKFREYIINNSSIIDNTYKTKYFNDKQFENIVENLYGRYYIDNNYGAQTSKLRHMMIRNVIANNVNLKYELKGKVEINLIRLNNSCQLKIKNKVYPSILTNDVKFPYKFITKEGNFYVDSNSFLWMEILAALSIQNKLFLNPYKS